MDKNEEFKINYSIEYVTLKDSEEVIALLKKFFFKDEPLNAAIELGDCKELEEYSLKCIPDECSFKAVNSDGKIIGVFLNGLLRRPDPNVKHFSFTEKCKHEKFKIIMALMDFIDSKFNLFDNYPDISTVLDGKILSVDNKYRGCGIASRLTEATLSHMKENKLSLMHVMCSSYYSARVMEKLGFEEVYNLRYNDFVINGKVLLKPPPPHESCKIFVKKIKKT